MSAAAASGRSRHRRLDLEPTPFLRRDRRFRAVTVAAPAQLRRPDLRLSVDTRRPRVPAAIVAIAGRDAARSVAI
jgi:hypothetical protein